MRFDAETNPCIVADERSWILPGPRDPAILHQQICRRGRVEHGIRGIVTLLLPGMDGQGARILAVDAALLYDTSPLLSGEDDAEGVHGSVPLTANAPIAAWALAPSLVALPGHDGAIALIDTATGSLRALIAGSTSTEAVELVQLLPDGRHLLQVDRGGAFRIHALDGSLDEKPLLAGQYVDDELAIHDRALNYEATPEGASFVQLKFLGDDSLYALSNLAALRRHDGLVTALLAGAPLPAAPLPLPPRIDLSERRDGMVRLRRHGAPAIGRRPFRQQAPVWRPHRRAGLSPGGLSQRGRPGSPPRRFSPCPSSPRRLAAPHRSGFGHLHLLCHNSTPICAAYILDNLRLIP